MDANIIEIYEKLISGIKFFFADKPHKITLGLSGGLDSALVLALAYQALPNADFHVILMPSQFSTQHSVSDSLHLLNNLKGVKHSIIDIEPIFKEFEKTLNPLFQGKEFDVTEENLQARIRGTLLMAFSNKHGHLVLNTSNKSELSMGYGTLYGDLCGAVSVIGDVYKTQAYAICKHINRNGEIIPQNIIKKAPSAELRHNQKDSDSLPDYNILDKILYRLIEEGESAEEIIKQGFAPSMVKRINIAINSSNFKLLQIPPIIQVTDRPLVPQWKCIKTN